MKNICFPPTAYCLLLTAFCLLPAALRGVRAGGTLRPYRSLGQNVFSTGKEETVVTLKLKDQCGNVIENKGPPWKTRRQSGNVTENKGSYVLKAGMSLKTLVVSRPQELSRRRTPSTFDCHL